MDQEKVLRKINRQLRGIKVALSFFGLLIIVMLALLGFIAYKVVTFTRSVDTKINAIQQTTEQKLDLKKQLCDSSSSNAITDQICQ